MTVALPSAGRAQVPPVAPNPLAPTLNMPTPLGVQRGVPLDLTLTGANLAEPTGLWTSFPAKVTIPTDKNNGKDNGSLRVRLEVPKDAPLGFHTIRLATTRGLSNFRIFCVDDLPQMTALATNRAPTTPQPLPIPCVVVGRADAEVTDYYKITVAAGQRVSFEVLGHRLGSAFDPQLSIVDARTSREVAYSNDAPGLQTDARLTHVFKEGGDYLVEIRDTTYRGGGDFVYRLRIGDFPCATTPIPMAARRGTRVKVAFAGPTVDGVAPVDVAVPANPHTETLSVAPRGANGLYGWPVTLAVGDLDEVVEQEPNNEPAKANRIPAPGGVTGRFQEKGDVDYYVFAAKKAQRLQIQAQTHELQSPAEVYVTLKDAKGAQLGVTNPAMAPRIDFTAPADGDYFLVVEHLNYWGGPEQTYHLTLTPPEPGIDLTLGLDRYDIHQGGVAMIPIQTVVRREFNGPIEVSVVGNPALSGSTVLQPVAPVPNQPAGHLFILAKPDAPVGPGVVTIEGKATVNGKVVLARANVTAVVTQNLGGLHFPPRDLLHEIGIAVTPKAPFALTAKFDHDSAYRGGAAPLTVTAARVAGFTEEITLAPLGLPPSLAPALKNIPKGQNAIKVQLTPAANAALGSIVVSFTGKAKFQNKDYLVIAAPVDLAVGLPFDLKVEPSSLTLKQGAKAKLKVTAMRKGGYSGPIALEVRSLPASVTAPKATIAKDQTTAEIEVTAAPTAAVASKADVSVLGTASGAANQQTASPKFTVSVVKK
jgi:hypothetical protein